MFLFSLTIISIAFTFYVFFGLILKTFELSHDRNFLKTLRSLPDSDLPKVSVIIPARNEERNIERSVSSCIAFDYPNFEILVADDGSTDNTLSIVNEVIKKTNFKNIHIVPIKEEDESDRTNWVYGKSFVLWRASYKATGEWLLFIDADTKQKKDGLWKAVTFSLNNNLHAFSSSGIYVNPGFWGDLLEGLIYIAVFLIIPLRKVNDSKEKIGWMNGQFILIKKEDYLKIEGHQPLKKDLLEDIAFAHLLKKERVPFLFVPAGELYHCTNYVGYKEAYTGWTRLLAIGTPWLNKGIFYFITAILIAFLTGILSFISLVSLAAGCAENYSVGGISTTMLIWFQLAFAYFVVISNRIAMKMPIINSLFLPLSALLLIKTYIGGFYTRFINKKIILKDRTIELE